MRDDLRESVISAGLAMMEKGLSIGTGGNVSVRLPGTNAMLITPSGIPYCNLKPEDIVEVDLDGWSFKGKLKPSVEYRIHGEIYKARPDVGAIVHVHSFMAISLAVARKSLPAITDLCAFSLGGQVEVADYAMSGSAELAENAVRALGKKNAVLMANHGSLCVASSPSIAMDRCELLEKLCACYINATILGGAHVIPEETIQALKDRLGSTYGQGK